jgi:hypothetical protein
MFMGVSGGRNKPCAAHDTKIPPGKHQEDQGLGNKPPKDCLRGKQTCGFGRFLDDWTTWLGSLLADLMGLCKSAIASSILSFL